MILSFVVVMFGCGGGGDTSSTTSVAEAKDPEAQKGLELITKSDCFTCHKLHEAGIGPAYAEVSAKYKTLNKESTDSIVRQIIKGGVGKWGSVPMLPHPQINEQDATSMAHYIMSIKK